MKKSVGTIRWIAVALFGIMSVYAISENGYLGALLFLLGGAIITPIDIIQKFRYKFKFNKAFSIVLSIILLFAGALATPTSDSTIDNNNNSQISSTVSNYISNTNQNENILDDNSSKISSIADNPSSKEEISSNPTEVSSFTTPSSKPQVSSNNNTTSNTSTSSITNTTEIITLSNIPDYSGKPFVVINNNIPIFSVSELTKTGYEKYSDLDSLGRTQTALASVGKDTMPKPNEDRGSISNIKPTGWEQAKYESINGGWLYNRCHLIGWQLSAENANKKNLITGTKYLNINGMLPFENMIADYIKETGNHVAYRITPIYQGNNLLASGIQMEAFSVEDNGKGICFNIYCYNVQPNIPIDYITGISSGPVYITEQVSTTYHSTKKCSTLSKLKVITLTLVEAKNKGLVSCSKCH